jgi:hypothetical protein
LEVAYSGVGLEWRSVPVSVGARRIAPVVGGGVGIEWTADVGEVSIETERMKNSHPIQWVTQEPFAMTQRIA